jgi:hypothetical protein
MSVLAFLFANDVYTDLLIIFLIGSFYPTNQNASANLHKVGRSNENFTLIVARIDINLIDILGVIELSKELKING